MIAVPQDLDDAARAFAADIADLLLRTITDDAPIRHKAKGSRVVVAAYNHEGDRTRIPLHVDGVPRFGLSVTSFCTWDSSGAFLAVDESTFTVSLHGQGEPIVRMHYRRSRSWGASHVHVHAESGALAFGLAGRELNQPPKTQMLHIPTGSRRFRPCLEDVIELLFHDLDVDTKAGWQARIDEGRRRWHELQLAAAIRDAIRADPHGAPDRLRREIDAIVANVTEPGAAAERQTSSN